MLKRPIKAGGPTNDRWLFDADDHKLHGLNDAGEPAGFDDEVAEEIVAAVNGLYSALAREWVSVSERFPERGSYVLIAWNNSPLFAVSKFGGKRWIDPHGDDDYDFTPPTHWQSLPKPPALSHAGQEHEQEGR